MSAWPESIWDAAALRGVDGRGRKEIEGAGGIDVVGRGAKIFSSGEPADDFFVVERGGVDVRAAVRGQEKLRVIRRAVAGDAFGEESMLRVGASRQLEAVAATDARVARIPMGIFSRVAERSGGSVLWSAKKRSLERAAAFDLLRTMALTSELDEKDLERLLDASELRAVPRGMALFRAEDPATHWYFVLDGMFQLQTEADGRAHVRAYLSRGDEVGDVELETNAHHTMSAMASGASSVLAIRADATREVAARYPQFFELARRTTKERTARQVDLARQALTTQHVLKDLYRLDVARSLLVIDQDSCVRCGHCAWSCASSHDDGVARLVRRGDKVVTSNDQSASSLLLPSSCQHCENPACMIDCPTGAIGRDPHGDVFIREAICIGCGNCAKGCPWDNIQMAPRSSGNKALSAIVAVKCDLCEGRDEGPACVAACPVQAIARISPQASIAELGAIRGASKSRTASLVARPKSARAWWAGAAALAVAASLTQVSAMITGVASGLLCLALLLYPGFKRVTAARALGEPRVVDRDRADHSRVRVHYVAHVGVGTFAIGVVLAHVVAHAWSVLGAALAVAFVVTSGFGISMAIAYAFAPRVLTRLDRQGALPEDIGERIREARERAFTELTGKTDLVKAIYRRLVAPYAESSVATIRLVLSGRPLREEERRLRSRVDEMLSGRGAEKLDGLDVLIRGAVERRALVAERILNRILRGGYGVHVVASALLVALMIMHALFEVFYRR